MTDDCCFGEKTSEQTNSYIDNRSMGIVFVCYINKERRVIFLKKRNNTELCCKHDINKITFSQLEKIQKWEGIISVLPIKGQNTCVERRMFNVGL